MTFLQAEHQYPYHGRNILSFSEVVLFPLWHHLPPHHYTSFTRPLNIRYLPVPGRLHQALGNAWPPCITVVSPGPSHILHLVRSYHVISSGSLLKPHPRQDEALEWYPALFLQGTCHTCGLSYLWLYN